MSRAARKLPDGLLTPQHQEHSEDELRRGVGRRNYVRFSPPRELPELSCTAQVTGLSDWRTARRVVADIGIGGVSAWLSPRELDQVVIGDKVYVELYLPCRGFILTGLAVHRRVMPGAYWTRRVLGVSFLDSPDLRLARGELVDYLLELREVGAEAT